MINFAQIRTTPSMAIVGMTAADRIAEVYASLAEDQEPLGSEFEAVWDANAATLYEA